MFGFFSILFIIMGFGITIPASAWLVASILAFLGLVNTGVYISKKDRLPDEPFAGIPVIIVIINILFPVFSLPWVIWGVIITLGLLDLAGTIVNGDR